MIVELEMGGGDGDGSRLEWTGIGSNGGDWTNANAEGKQYGRVEDADGIEFMNIVELFSNDLKPNKIELNATQLLNN